MWICCVTSSCAQSWRPCWCVDGFNSSVAIFLLVYIFKILFYCRQLKYWWTNALPVPVLCWSKLKNFQGCRLNSHVIFAVWTRISWRCQKNVQTSQRMDNMFTTRICGKCMDINSLMFVIILVVVKKVVEVFVEPIFWK